MPKKPKVFFNASVILAGLNSPKGGSGKVTNWSRKGKVQGYVSEVVLEEAKRNADKIRLTPKKIEKEINQIAKIVSAPENIIKNYQRIVKDVGDIHLLTSAENLRVDYLVSLDKKHILPLAKKVRKFKITSPGSLITDLRENQDEIVI